MVNRGIRRDPYETYSTTTLKMHKHTDLFNEIIVMIFDLFFVTLVSYALSASLDHLFHPVCLYDE